MEGLSFRISHRADEAADSPPIHLVGARQELGRVPASGRPRIALHSLVQDYLNRTENLRGIVTNGLTLRLLRNCTFVRRQAYVEFDLAGTLEEQRFQDFAALYRLLHSTRLPRGAEDARRLLARKVLCPFSRAGWASSRASARRRRAMLDHARQRLSAPSPPTTNSAGGIAPSCSDLRSDRSREPVPPALRSWFTGSFSCSFLGGRPEERFHRLYREHSGIARLRRLLDHRGGFQRP